MRHRIGRLSTAATAGSAAVLILVATAFGAVITGTDGNDKLTGTPDALRSELDKAGVNVELVTMTPGQTLGK